MVYIPQHSLYLFLTFLYMYLLFKPECTFPRGQFSYYLFIDWVTLSWHPTASCPNSRTQQVFSRKEFIVSTRQQTSRGIYVDGFLEPSFPSWTSILQKKAQRYAREKEFNTGKTRGHLVPNREEFILGNQGSQDAANLKSNSQILFSEFWEVWEVSTPGQQTTGPKYSSCQVTLSLTRMENFRKCIVAHSARGAPRSKTKSKCSQRNSEEQIRF